MKQISDRNEALDLLRGISILFVLFGHYGVLYNIQKLFYEIPNDNMFFFSGICGVYLFFILSGYLILDIYIRNTNSNFFLKRRINRLIPTFIISASIAYFIESFFQAELANRWSSFEDFIQTILSICSFGILYESKWQLAQGAYWSLITEFKFYLIIAIMMSYRLSPTKVVLFLSCLSLSLFLISMSSIKVLLASLPFFIFGMTLRLRENNNNSFLNFLHFVPILIIIIFCFSSVETPSFSFRSIDLGQIIFLFAFSYILISYKFISIFKNKYLYFLRWLGWISFPLYIVHQEIGLILDQIYKPYLDNVYLKFCEVLFLKLLLVLSLATFIHYFVERKFLFQK